MTTVVGGFPISRFRHIAIEITTHHLYEGQGYAKKEVQSIASKLMAMQFDIKITAPALTTLHGLPVPISASYS